MKCGQSDSGIKLSSSSHPNPFINAPDASAVGGEEEEDEAEEHRRLAVVCDRCVPESCRHVRHEVGYGHLSGGYKCC